MLALLDRLSGYQIESFNVSLCARTRIQFARIFAHPALSCLRSIVLFCDYQLGKISSDLLRALIALPELCSLELWPARVNPDCDWSLLGQLRSLTSLEIADEPLGLEPRLLAGAASLPHLRRLSLTEPAFHALRFQELFCRPNIAATLECLHLRLFSLDLDPEEAVELLRPGFAALTKLTRLQLSQIDGIDSLLPFAGFAPALRSIELHIERSWDCHPAGMPTCPVIEHLFTQAPQVHLLILLQCPDAVLTQLTVARFGYVQAHFAGRFSLESSRI